MNITEGNDANTLLRYLLGLPGRDGKIPSDESARLAAMMLADRAHKALAAGLTARDVNDRWGQVEVCPAVEVTQ